MHLKKLITNLTRTDVSPLILRLKGEKHAFTFEDIEKESGIKLTSADKFYPFCRREKIQNASGVRSTGEPAEVLSKSKRTFLITLFIVLSM